MTRGRALDGCHIPSPTGRQEGCLLTSVLAVWMGGLGWGSRVGWGGVRGWGWGGVGVRGLGWGGVRGWSGVG